MSIVKGAPWTGLIAVGVNANMLTRINSAMLDGQSVMALEMSPAL